MLRHPALDRSPDHPAYPLPVPLTSFIGRQKELAEIKQLLVASRLLTLTGAGGCGKTRLAVGVATDLCPAYADGVCWVDLAPLADASLLSQAVAQALRVPERPGNVLLDAILDFLHPKHLLLVLDNCEHLATACGEFAHDVLCEVPRVNILATSREPLAIVGEVLYPVAPLALPPKSHATDIAVFDSIRLFVERARDVLPNFRLTTVNAQPVTDICRRLDGIPLAIELASVRVNALSIEQIAARLDDRFVLLTSARRGVPSHHRTLRAALDWSYSWLPAAEQLLLRRLSVFSGGCTLDAVEHVCASTHPRSEAEGSDGNLPGQIVDALSSLVSKSLVVAETLEPGESRYGMLETVRQFARDRLCESDESDVIQDRHLDYFLSLAQEAERAMHGPDELAWLDRLDVEHDNLRAALDWSRRKGRVETNSQLVKALLWFWVYGAHLREGRERAEELLARPEAAARNLIRANALLVAGITTSTWNLGDESVSHRYLTELVELARELGDPGKRHLALGLFFLSETTSGGNSASAEQKEESLAIARSLDEQWLVAHVLRWHGKTKPSERCKLREESLRICQSIGDKRGTAESLWKLGQALFSARDDAGARRHLEQSLPHLREVRDRSGTAAALIVLGELERAANRYDKAKQNYLECLEICRNHGRKLVVEITLSNLAFVFLHDGDLNSAKSLFSEALAVAREANATERGTFELLGFAAVLTCEKNARRAVSLFAFFESWLGPAHDGTVFGRADKAEYERYLALARKQLDEGTFNAAWAEGQKMTLEQAMAEVEREIVLSPLARRPDLSHDPNALTPRELEVLRLLAGGCSDAQIATELVISRRTVSTHLTAIYGKLGVNSRAAATRHALDHKLV